MPNIQLNAIDTKSDIQNANNLKSHIPVSLPVYDDDDSSNNSKKSKRFIFNKMQTASPKLDKSFSQMTAQEKIAYLQSLSQKDQQEFLNQNVNKVMAYVNSLPQAQRDQIFSKLDKFADQILNGKNLSQGDKNELNNAMNNLINRPTGPSGSGDDYNDGITNIMMIIVKAFVQNMNTQSQDELARIFESSLINTYLENVQKQMQKDIAAEQKKAKEMDSGKGKRSPLKIATLVITIVVAVVMVACIFFPPAEILAGMATGAVDVAASTAEVVSDTVSVLQSTIRDTTSGIMDGFSSADDLILDDPSTLDSTFGEETASDSAADSVADSVADESASSSTSTSTSTSSSTTTDVGEQTADQVADELQEMSDAETQTGKDNGSKADNAAKGRGWARMSEATSDNWNEKILGKTKIADGIFEGGDKVTGLKNVGKGLGKAAMAAGGVYGGGTLLNTVVGKNGQQAKQDNITADQQKVGSATAESDILNNTEQNVSKRVSDDSEKISQSSGYVQQAINMLGTAMSFKV